MVAMKNMSLERLRLEELCCNRQLALVYLLSIKFVLQSRKVPKYFDQWFADFQKSQFLNIL